jgi:hypothetical protein
VALTPLASQRGTLHLLETPPRDEDDEVGTAGRVIIESLVGIGVGGGSAALGALMVADRLDPSKVDPEWYLVPALFYVLGSSVGVMLTGQEMAGRGSHGYTLLGGVLGFAVPGAISAGLIAVKGCYLLCGFEWPLAIGAIVLPVVGAILGYELSAPAPWLSLGQASSTPPPAPRLVPVLAPARQGLGLTVGLAGRL